MIEVNDQQGDERIRAAIKGQTVPSLFRDTVQENGDAPAFRWKVGDDWQTSTWNQYADQASRTSSLLSECGIERGQRVALMLRNRPEFHPIDMGAYLAGAVPFSLYNSSSPDQLTYLLSHSEAKIVVVDSVFADTVRGVVGDLDTPIKVIVVGGDPVDEEISWEDAIQAVEPDDFVAACERVDPEDLATLIYTSGTTGPPKAVMLRHRNISWLLHSLAEALNTPMKGRRMLSYLPMAHVAERIFTHYLPAREGAVVTPCDDPAAVGAYLPEVRPEAFFGPPRVFDRTRSALLAGFASSPEALATLERGVELGKTIADARARQTDPPAEVVKEWEEIDAAMFQGIRARIGLDACQVALTGAAPAPVEVMEFFNAIGLRLTECYGLSEDTGLISAAADRPIAGTVGRPIPGCSIRLLDDGEILCKGGHVFAGYFKDEGATAAALDEDGWLRTGDIGRLRSDGYLEIVDRKKELIITAGGKNISPANIEAKLKQQPLIADVCVIGDRRHFVTAVLTLDREGASAFASEHGLESLSIEDLADHPDLRKQLDANVAEVNEQLSNVERIKKYHLSTDEWQPDSDVLTPTMKLKRRGVLSRYSSQIDALYEGT